MTNEFSLRIINQTDGNCILFENSILICKYRDSILDQASKLGGTVHDRFNVTVPSSKEYSDLLLFITKLERGFFTVTLNTEELSYFERTPFIENSWSLIVEHAKKLGGTLTPIEDFNFKNSDSAKAFINYLVALNILSQY